MNNLIEDLKAYFNNTPQTKIDEDWAKYAEYDKVGPKVSDLLTHFETHFSYQENPEIEQELESNNIKSESPNLSGFFFVD